MSGDGTTPVLAVSLAEHAAVNASPRAPATLTAAWDDDDALDALNDRLDALDATARIAWALANFGGGGVLSSSFGAQAAASLHLVTAQAADIPVVLVDTGYLFPETYRFVDALRSRLRLNLHVATPPESAAWFEARHGALWAQGLEGIDRYNHLRKVAPMNEALDTLGATLWIAGLRRSQSSTREYRRVLERAGGRWKLHPIVDWSDRDVGAYLRAHDLPYHPLWERGYVSIGDVHTTRPLAADVDTEATRFFGLKRECGLHDISER